MSIAERLQYSFSQTTTIQFGTKDSLPADFDAIGMVALKTFLFSFLESKSIQGYERLEDLFYTDGHADIHYRGIRFVDQNGGLALVFAEQAWGGDFISLQPWITLYGEWVKRKEQLQQLLTEKYN